MAVQQKIIFNGEGKRLNVLGDNVTLKLTGEDTSGSFTLIEQSNPPGVGIPLHVHRNEDELFCVLEGTVAFTVGGETIEAGPGSTVFLPREIPHAFIATGDKPVKTLVTALPSGIEHMFHDLSALPAGPPDMPAVFEICGRYGITFLAPPDAAEDSLADI